MGGRVRVVLLGSCAERLEAMSRGRPKVSANTYSRDKRLSEKYPTLPEMSDEVAWLCQWPQTEADEAKCDAEIARVSRAIRTTCRHHHPLTQEPYEIPLIAMADVMEGATRRGAIR